MGAQPGFEGAVSCGRYLERPGARECVVLAHGLGGDPFSSWGAPGSPGACAERLARDLPAASFFYLDYDARVQTRLDSGARSLPALAEDAAAAIAALLERHARVALVGHCLGGLLLRFALRHLLTQTRGVPLSSARRADAALTLVLLDTPEDWPLPSAPGPGPDRRIAAVMRAIGLDAGALRASARWWSDKQGPAGAVTDHAVLSTGESWIAPLGPGAPVPAARRATLDCAHADLTRIAPDRPDPRYRAILDALVRDRAACALADV